MAVSVETLPPATDVWGAHPVALLQVTLDSSYTASGGEALDLRSYRPSFAAKADPGLVIVSPANAAAAGYQFAYDITNRKLVVKWVDTTTDGAPMAEVTAATDLSGVIVNLVAIWGF